MRWSKIKNIIILLLVIVNVCLLAMVGLRAWQTRKSDRETREWMVAVLAKNGIEFLPDEVPGVMPLTGARVTLSGLEAREAAALVGEITDTNTAGSRTTYEGSLGTAVVSDSGEIEIRMVPGALALKGDDPGQRGLELLEQLGLQMEETGRETGSDTVKVTYTQFWDGAPVPDVTLTLVWRSGSLESLTGRALRGTSEAVMGNWMDASTALARFLENINQQGYVCSQITELYAGYTVSGTTEVTVSPTWFIETDTHPQRFAVDASAGTVTADGS